MKKIHIITKTIWQCFLVLIEVVGISYSLVLLSSSLRPFVDYLDIIERISLFIAIYEVFVYITLTFINDARQDALLALMTSYKLGLLFCETGNDQIRKILDQDIEKQLENHMFNHLDIRKGYSFLKDYIDTRDTISIKLKLVFISHNYEACNLKWRFSFLLSLFK
jgi:hypothetical protein